MVDVSVIILNYNTFALTCECIRSVIQFTEGISYEIILVDNASTEREPKEFKTIFPDLVLLASSENLGFAGGNNLGLRNANGGTILLLNSDAKLKSNAIGVYHQMLLSLADEVKIISCKLTFPDGQVQPSCGRFPSIRLQLMELFRLQKVLSKKRRGEMFLGNFFDYAVPVYPDWVWATFFMFKRDAIDLFPKKKLPDTYFLYMEDMEWCYYIAERGGKIYFDPEHSIIHHRGSSTEIFFGDNLNPTIKNNFIDLVARHKGKVYAKLFFGLTRLNIFISSTMKRFLE